MDRKSEPRWAASARSFERRQDKIISTLKKAGFHAKVVGLVRETHLPNGDVISAPRVTVTYKGKATQDGLSGARRSHKASA